MHHRRQSNQSSDQEATNVFTFSETPDAWGGFPGPAGTMATLGVDHLDTQAPYSPGGVSMQSEWSELSRLERSDSIGSYHSTDSLAL